MTADVCSPVVHPLALARRHPPARPDFFVVLPSSFIGEARDLPVCRADLQRAAVAVAVGFFLAVRSRPDIGRVAVADVVGASLGGDLAIPACLGVLASIGVDAIASVTTDLSCCSSGRTSSQTR
ncbi:hypothetical protein H113_05258 [Trichophyton rubrum MR1459]|uniref:Uncharacterized protein n=1 Tax=Trichophyton rubrum (strain ATCC MYA-4607 / CBS 118892) TaxID=559305 RepID=A0A080WLL2_TRIRC|nr:uncharacterized protein TERG_11926 [Trichophyton rubrum CBS 118892]EZF94351.1 hypothetical protein H113_05258 [Trichophyton rubrum MR1459]EZG05328.1 hypothetical protein H106_05059 [Trichophyton rubrum CBS 735.88]KFL61025.1 hypothetical protein TERG_11926 [Trichophyton rubrum CBS 118892]